MVAEDELPELPVDHDILDKLKARITVARRIDSAQHQIKKRNHERKWTLEAAEALGIDVDSDVISDIGSDDDGENGGKDGGRRGKKARETKGLKNELRMMLSQPVMARGISAKYITSGSRMIAHELAVGESEWFPSDGANEFNADDVRRVLQVTRRS